MLPLGHLALAYLWYVVVALARRRPIPAGVALVPLAVGSQAPDLVDKPLAYYEVVAYGRSVAHSLLTFIVVTVVVWWVVQRSRDRWRAGSWQARLWTRTPLAFSVGMLSHIVGDAWRPIVSGNPWKARFVLWPLYRMPPGVKDAIPPWTRLLRLWGEMTQHPQIGLVLVATLVFIGVRVLVRFLGRRWLREPRRSGNVQSGDEAYVSQRH